MRTQFEDSLTSRIACQMLFQLKEEASLKKKQGEGRGDG